MSLDQSLQEYFTFVNRWNRTIKHCSKLDQEMFLDKIGPEYVTNQCVSPKSKKLIWRFLNEANPK